MLIKDAISLPKSAIYKIVNTANSNVYVGSSMNIQRRYESHRHDLKKGIHRNSHLQRSYDKYNKEPFLFIIIEECEPLLLIQREQHYIDSLNPQYNICKIAASNLGLKWSDETKRKMSISQTGRKHSEESIQKMRILAKGKRPVVMGRNGIPILQFDKNNNLLAEYSSQTEACLKTGLKEVCGALKKKRKTAGGFIWRYKSEIAC